MGTGAARIWSAAEGPERVPLADNRTAVSAVAAEDGHILAGEDHSNGDLFFIHLAGAGSLELPTPTARDAALRADPALFTSGDRLEGVAWLEGSGPQDFGVFASAWNGTSWERVEAVSIEAPGPQLALSATVLDDGSWLLLWAGFDGTDDDIFWSRRQEDGWSKPKRLHADNRVPDILPTVAAGDTGARAAWSFFDGNDYRVRTARWTGSGWSLESALPGRGPGQAVLETIDGRSFLTFQTVAPAVWNLVEFENGNTRRLATFPDIYSEQPLIVPGDGSGASLAWPWRNGGRR